VSERANFKSPAFAAREIGVRLPIINVRETLSVTDPHTSQKVAKLFRKVAPRS